MFGFFLSLNGTKVPLLPVISLNKDASWFINVCSTIVLCLYLSVEPFAHQPNPVRLDLLPFTFKVILPLLFC